MEISRRKQSYQVKTSLTEGQVDCEIRNVRTMLDDLEDSRGIVRILLRLCKSNQKIDSAELRGALKAVEEKLEGAEDLANGLRTLLESFTPTPDSLQRAKDTGAGELCLVPAELIHES